MTYEQFSFWMSMLFLLALLALLAVGYFMHRMNKKQGLKKTEIEGGVKFERDGLEIVVRNPRTSGPMLDEAKRIADKMEGTFRGKEEKKADAKG